MNSSDIRLSQAALKVLRELLSSPRGEHSGASIAKASKIGSGTLYPLLARLEEAGWVTSKWETIDPREAGRPRRRFYTLTGVGQQNARAALAELQFETGALAWVSQP